MHDVRAFRERKIRSVWFRELVEVEGAEESEVRDILYEEETSPAVSFVNQTLI